MSHFAHDLDCFVEFWVNPRGYEWRPIFETSWRRGDWLAGGREGDPEAFLFLLAGV